MAGSDLSLHIAFIIWCSEAKRNAFWNSIKERLVIFDSAEGEKGYSGGEAVL
jgi:hypothetical protein